MAERYSPEELELIAIYDEEAGIDSEQETEEGDSEEEEEEDADVDSEEEEAEVDDEEEAEFDSEFEAELDGDESEFDGVEYSGEEDYAFYGLEDYRSEEEEEEEEESDSDEDYEPLGGELENGGDSGREKRSRTEAEEECDSPETSSDENESDLDEIDGLFCPICTEPWTNEGDHRVCCLPCGHLYGLSCISKWLILHEDQGKCPQCNRECSLEDVRKLFASQIVAIDEKLQKRIRSLEAKCDSLQKQKAEWKIKEINWKNLEANWGWERRELTKCPTCKRKCALKDVRKLFVPQIVAVDDKLQKRIRALEARCDLLQIQKTALESIETDWKKLEVALDSSYQMQKVTNRKLNIMMKLILQMLAERNEKMQDSCIAKRLAEHESRLAQEQSKFAQIISLMKEHHIP